MKYLWMARFTSETEWPVGFKLEQENIRLRNRTSADNSTKISVKKYQNSPQHWNSKPPEWNAMVHAFT